jgi:hypothetical protein
MAMTRRFGAADIQLEPPIVRSAETLPAVEDRSYLGFILSAFAIALGGGFLIAVLLPLAESGTIAGAQRVPRLIQAHGWAQLQGWAGLFVAGMALRLLPRFAGRKPLQRKVNLVILALLVPPIIARTVIEPFGAGTWGDTLMLIAAIVAAAGAAAVAGVIAVTLMRGRKKHEPWRYFAWAGAACWLLWAALILAGGIKAVDHARYTPAGFDDTVTWTVMLGAIGNFIWGVQSRSVPVFFGRKPPAVRKVVIPGVLLNLGVMLLAISLLPMDDALRERVAGAGLALAGAGTAWLAPVCGAVWGAASRLRPRARDASRFVLVANVAAVLAGVLLAWAGIDSLIRGEFAAFALRDAARHAFGLGLITVLILGMVQLIAPVFALSRAEARPPSAWERAVFWLLLAALLVRVTAALLLGHMDSDSRLHLVSTSGVLAWVALALFAATLVQAIRREPRMKALLATGNREPGTGNRERRTGDEGIPSL